MTHTPGPWKLLKIDNRKWAPADQNNHSILSVVEEDGVMFAVVYEEADGHLIAAAPDMLQALQIAEEQYENFAGAGKDDGTLGVIRAAIAKARRSGSPAVGVDPG